MASKVTPASCVFRLLSGLLAGGEDFCAHITAVLGPHDIGPAPDLFVQALLRPPSRRYERRRARAALDQCRDQAQPVSGRLVAERADGVSDLIGRVLDDRGVSVPRE